MARTHLTLAALATSAVPELDLAGSAPYGSRHGDFDAAVLGGRDGRTWLISIPRSEAAEAEQSAELLALRALTAGVRDRLPFAISDVAGQLPVDGTRAVVTEWVDGDPTPVSAMHSELASSVGRAIAAVHELPTGFVTETGLPTLNAVHALQTCLTVVERSIATNLLPAALRERWESALQDDRLWQFSPTVVHGTLSTEAVRHQDADVTGILEWRGLRVADPALDLAWVLGGRRSDAADWVFGAYTLIRGSADRQLRQRATFYAELEIAKWLLHGTETRSTETVDDAVQLLHGLVDDVQGDLMNPLGPPTAPILAVTDVQALLDRVERNAS